MKTILPAPTMLAMVCAPLIVPTLGWPAPSIEAVSVVNPGLLSSSSAQGDSFVLSTTPNGAFVLFVSTANNLVTNDHNGPFLDLFLKCRTNATLRLVSANAAGSSGGAGNTIQADMTPDGRHVVFQSEADDLVTNDLNQASDIFVCDMIAGTTTLVSRNYTSTGSGNGDASSPTITPDGRFVAFISKASDLVADDTNGIPDVFVRDLDAGITTLVSVGARSPANPPSAIMDPPALTPDGRFVAFSSTALGLVTTGATLYQEVYVRDLSRGQTLCASTNVSAGSTPVSYAPVLSDDGRFVAFKTGTGGNSRPWFRSLQLHRRDLQTGHLDLISTNIAGIGPTALDSYGPAMTPDGRFVAFTESLNSANLSPIWLWDAQAQAAELVSANLHGQPSTSGLCDSPSITPDGRYVLFLSNGSDLVTDAVNGGFQSYFRDLQWETTLLASADRYGLGSGGVDLAPVLSANGRFAGFDSLSDSLVSDDLNTSYDSFTGDMAFLNTELISTANPAQPVLTGNRTSAITPDAVSADGHLVVFESWASDLVPGDTNGLPDIFVRDLVAGTNGLVSVSRFGTVSTNGASRTPSISANGRFIVFMSTSADLVVNDANRLEDVFVRDLETATTALVSVGATGGSGNGASTAASISTDGRRIAFQSQASNLAGADTEVSDDVFVRDLVAGTTTLVSSNRVGDSSTMVFTTPIISPDGRWVAFEAYSSPDGITGTIRAVELQNGSTLLLGTIAGSCGFSGDGQVLAAVCTSGSVNQLVVADLVQGTVTPLVLGANAPSSSHGVSLNADGRFVAFSSRGALVGSDANGVEDVFVLDRRATNLCLISVKQTGDASGNGRSFWPRISSDGRYVAFRSAAGDLVPGDDNGVDDLFHFDRRTGQTTLVSRDFQGGPTGSGPSTGFACTPDGALVVFNSLASDLVPGDFNGMGDVFAASIPLVATTDSDHDGLEDAWELQCFGDLSHNAATHSDADGLTDGEEYRAGTDPSNADSVLKLGNAAGRNGVVTLNWIAAPGRSYLLQYKDSLIATAWLSLPCPVTIVGSRASVVDATALGSPCRFYRLLLVE